MEPKHVCCCDARRACCEAGIDPADLKLFVEAVRFINDRRSRIESLCSGDHVIDTVLKELASAAARLPENRGAE